VRLKLASNAAVKGGALTVDSQGGVVTLGGSVESERQVNNAAAIARRVRGVKKVVNNIVARPH
jgi:osmotically-inducible protein OsmY